jgi:hypothetical protein
MKIIVSGNPVDGFTFTGPFASEQDAIYWADRYGRGLGDYWWIADLEGVPLSDDLKEED